MQKTNFVDKVDTRDVKTLKRKMSLYLLLGILLCFYTAVFAEQDVLWLDNRGFDPATGEGWKIDAGTLVDWEESNFEALAYQACGKSEDVGTGITVGGIKLQWTYPGIDSIGKGIEGLDLQQSLDYTIVARADISSSLRMNVFGYSGRNGVNNEFAFRSEGDEISTDNNNFMLFDTDYGGIVDEDWNFVEVSAVDYATGEAPNLHIHASDLWTADLWANVPYGFTISSTGLGDSAGLEELLYIEMRYLEDEDLFQITQSNGWNGDFVLDEDGVEIGQYDAGQYVHINMQFRIPITGAPAGRYQGEVTFSTYTI